MDWVIGSAAAALVAAGALLWKPIRARRRTREIARALALFRSQREQLEAKFFDLARSQGKPRGLRWVDCDWQHDVAFARDLRSGLLTAFVGVNIQFEAVEGGDMEGVEHVGLIRDAAAVFHYRKGRWGTGGRTLFNMNPEDALTRLVGQFEPIGSTGHATQRV